MAADNKFLPPPRADGKPTAPQNVSETDQSKNLRQGADALEKRGKEALAKDPKSVKGQQDLKDAATMREKAQQADINAKGLAGGENKANSKGDATPKETAGPPAEAAKLGSNPPPTDNPSGKSPGLDKPDLTGGGGGDGGSKGGAGAGVANGGAGSSGDGGSGSGAKGSGADQGGGANAVKSAGNADKSDANAGTPTGTAAGSGGTLGPGSTGSNSVDHLVDEAKQGQDAFTKDFGKTADGGSGVPGSTDGGSGTGGKGGNPDNFAETGSAGGGQGEQGVGSKDGDDLFQMMDKRYAALSKDGKFGKDARDIPLGRDTLR